MREVLREDSHRAIPARRRDRPARWRGLDRKRQAVARRLDDVMKQYVEVLKSSPENVDAAYNYEYVARLKKNLGKAKESALAKAAPAPPAEGELPSGPTIHGRPGAPPKGVD